MQSTASYLWHTDDLLGQGATASVYKARNKVRPQGRQGAARGPVHPGVGGRRAPGDDSSAGHKLGQEKGDNTARSTEQDAKEMRAGGVARRGRGGAGMEGSQQGLLAAPVLAIGGQQVRRALVTSLYCAMPP